MENRKELIKKFRELVSNDKPADRITLLSYAFLREVPYCALERVINEDRFAPPGTQSFIKWLAESVSSQIYRMDNPDIKSSTRWTPEILLTKKMYRDKVLEWMNEKYKTESISEESAA